MILFHAANSVCCQKVDLVVRARGIDLEIRPVSLFRAEQYDPAYLALNPNGLVPTLVHDGRVVIESTLICEYLDECARGGPQLMPQDPWLRSRMRVWTKMVDEGLHDAVTEISFSAMFRERLRHTTEPLRRARIDNVGDLQRRARYQSTYDLGVESPWVTFAVAAWDRAFGRLEAALQAGGPWILGADPSLADVGLMPYAARLSYLGLLDLWTAGRPAVEGWWARVREWPAFRSGLADVMPQSEVAEMARHGPSIRARLGAIRDGAREELAAIARRRA